MMKMLVRGFGFLQNDISGEGPLLPVPVFTTEVHYLAGNFSHTHRYEPNFHDSREQLRTAY